MKEIGGYIELDNYDLPMLYEDGIKLNCGRNALAYILKHKTINKIYMPKFMCDSCDAILKQYSVECEMYSIGTDFRPQIQNRKENEWLYLVNYYGQIENDEICKFGKNVIVDNTQAYFQEPIKGLDTIYTCRKFFGVSDGAILFSDVEIENKMEQDISYNRMEFVLGRYEKNAGEFYNQSMQNNDLFINEPIKRMSKLTENLLHGINYEKVRKIRSENFMYLHNHFNNINKLKLRNVEGAFMYPLYIKNGNEIRRKLVNKKIYIPVLWPDVFNRCKQDDIEFDMAMNILPLPVDQRYTIQDMKYIIKQIEILL